ncbi:MAG: hypothetical protein K2K24_04540, partial [Clostridia bacterium]|nr:hypothetical protein [Clostridia bacterium]
MKKLIKLSMIIPVVFIIGITLDIIGFRNEDEKLALAGSYVLGIGLAVTFFAVVVIGLIMFMTGKLTDTDDKKAQDDGSNGESEREREQRELKQINTSKRYENRANETEYMARHASNIYKNSTTKEKVFGWLFFGLLMTDFLLIIVFAYLGIIVGAIICGAIFAGTIVISGIIKKIQENRSMSAKVYTKSKKREILNGEVKSCNLSSSTSVGSGHNPYPT